MVAVDVGSGGVWVRVWVGVTGKVVDEAVTVRVLFSRVRTAAGVTAAQPAMPIRSAKAVRAMVPIKSRWIVVFRMYPASIRG